MATYPQPILDPPFDRQSVVTRAVQASAALVDVSRPVHSLDACHSLCLWTGMPNEFLDALFQRDRRIFLALAGTGCVLVLCFVGLGVYLGRVPWGAPNRMTLLVVALACPVVALVLFVLAAMSSGWLYRHAIQSRLDELQGAPNVSRPEFVKIEYPPDLRSKDRPITSDVAYVLCAPAQRRIIVEGVILRHIIRAEDVVELAQVETTDLAEMVEDTSSHLLRLTYRIDAQTLLTVGLEQDSLVADYLVRRIGRQALFDRIRTALGRK
jgi:hypothetical protein